MKVHGRSHEVLVTSGLLLASREAHRTYAKRVSDEKECVQKLRANQEAERKEEEIL